VKHIYNAAKQVSGAVSPDHETANSFRYVEPCFSLVQHMLLLNASILFCRECVLIRHPRVGEYAFGFITGQTFVQTDNGEIQLYSVYVPTNHGTVHIELSYFGFCIDLITVGVSFSLCWGHLPFGGQRYHTQQLNCPGRY